MALVAQQTQAWAASSREHREEPAELLCLAIIAKLSSAWWMSQRRMRREVPDIGPRAQHVIDGVMLTLEDRPFCEHGRPPRSELSIWSSLRPDVLLCEFCWGASQAMAAESDIRCSACGAPAVDKRTSAQIVGRPHKWLAVHFFLCRNCADADSHRAR